MVPKTTPSGRGCISPPTDLSSYVWELKERNLEGGWGRWGALLCGCFMTLGQWILGPSKIHSSWQNIWCRKERVNRIAPFSTHTDGHPSTHQVSSWANKSGYGFLYAIISIVFNHRGQIQTSSFGDFLLAVLWSIRWQTYYADGLDEQHNGS